VWGATCEAALIQLSDHVSIHAPVWGATNDDMSELTRQPVSIHAPVWGATIGRIRAWENS